MRPRLPSNRRRGPSFRLLFTSWHSRSLELAQGPGIPGTAQSGNSHSTQKDDGSSVVGSPFRWCWSLCCMVVSSMFPQVVGVVVVVVPVVSVRAVIQAVASSVP